jgi:hypothetical protein
MSTLDLSKVKFSFGRPLTEAEFRARNDPKANVVNANEIEDVQKAVEDAQKDSKRRLKEKLEKKKEQRAKKI